MKNKIITAVLLAFALVTSSVSFAEAVWLDKVIVQVEDDVILDSELQRRMNTVKHQLQASNTKMPAEEDIKKQVLEQLIMEQIQLQMANKAGVRVSDTELNGALERIAKENKVTVAKMKENLEIGRASCRERV